MTGVQTCALPISIPLGEHDLYASQEIKRAVAASFSSHGRPKEDGLVRVWDAVAAEVGPLDTIAKIGRYLKAIQAADDRFTGRAVKNITDAVKVRAMDFELPDEWMENPDLFLFKGYDEKAAMIRGLAKPITVEMVIQVSTATPTANSAMRTSRTRLPSRGWCGTSVGRKRRRSGIWGGRGDIQHSLAQGGSKGMLASFLLYESG